ncbi:MAG: hypothetical protein KKF41_04690 [Actinobacteria bacterium]|nr:hypothetical protein [Actinomycetota bacterium]MBU2686863.1 hypothetical protein [Actinomycetota bacterium]
MSAADKEAAREKLALFRNDPFHPSLRTKRIQGVPGMWESSINLDIRLTWRRGDEDGVFELSNIGKHDRTLKSP